MSLSAVIMALEQIAWRHAHDLQLNEQTASQLEEQAETLYRLAGRIRNGKDGKHGR